MKKIISWVAGSFFRQAGRFLFFIVIGGLIFLLIQHNDIQFKWTDLLGIEMVKASENNLVYNITNAQWSTAYNSGYSNMALGDDRLWTANGSFNSNQRFYIKTNVMNIPNSTDYIQVNIKFRPNNLQQILEIEDSQYNQICTNSYNQWPSTGEYYVSSFACKLDIVGMIDTPTYGLTLTYAYNSEMDQSPCYAVTNVGDTFTFQCPVPNTLNTVYGFVIRAHASQPLVFQGGIDQKIAVKLDSSSQIIENQNQNHNETISTITDTNTTSDSDNTASFFNETNTTSESALTSIVSAPVALINNLVVGSHDSICATLNSKQICLPSGDIIWNRGLGSGSSGGSHGGSGVHDNNHWFRGGTTEQFITFFNLVVGGFILYKCLLSLFNSVHKLLDPANSWVGVMRL